MGTGFLPHEDGTKTLQLTRSLWKAVMGDEHRIKIIQLAGGLESGTIEFGETDHVLDIGMSKLTYLAIFKECHSHWHRLLADSTVLDITNNLNMLSLPDLWDIYYMTVGYLITTNENHSVISLHEDTVLVLARRVSNSDHLLEQELDLVSSFLTSRLKRINKSSSLWCWAQKLTVMVIFNDYNSEASRRLCMKLIDRALKSMELHFANYYAGRFLQWLLEIVRPIPSVSNYFFDQLHAKCRSNLHDVSLWTLLGVFWRPPQTLNYPKHEYRKIVNGLIPYGFDISCEILELKPLKVQFLALEDIKWLLNVSCKILTPYKVLIDINYWTDRKDITAILQQESMNASNDLQTTLKRAIAYSDSLYENSPTY
jgi:hypothetical protein